MRERGRGDRKERGVAVPHLDAPLLAHGGEASCGHAMHERERGDRRERGVAVPHLGALLLVHGGEARCGHAMRERDAAGGKRALQAAPAFHVGRTVEAALDEDVGGAMPVEDSRRGGRSTELDAAAGGGALEMTALGKSSSVTFLRSRGLRNSKVSRSGAAPRITSFSKWTAR